MKTTTEIEIKVFGGRKYTDDIFALVEASKLSLDDEFMFHEPKTKEEKELKKLLTEAIKKGLKDFYRPIMDPSFNGKGGICYVKGRKPAVGESYDWWKETALKFLPERNSRLGTETEYIAFLGVLLKKLVSSGWSIAKAWNAVCNDSKELGHYRNSKNAKYEFEPTGSRKIDSYYDLANTYKILKHEETGFWIDGDGYYCSSNEHPLADLFRINHCLDFYYYGVGWLVLEK